MTNKLKVIKDYDKLEKEIKEQIKLQYPEGYSEHLIKFKNVNGDMVSALPFETEDRIYMVRMSVEKAIQIVEDDDDFEDDGTLKSNIREEYEDKHGGKGFEDDDDDFAGDDDEEEDNYGDDAADEGEDDED